MRYPLVHCCVLLLCCVRGYIGISISPQRNTNYRGSLPPQTDSRAQTVQTLLIDNYDSYTYNIWQLLAEVNGREPYVVYNDAYRSWEDLVAAVPPFDNIVLSPGPGDPSVAADFGLCMDAIQRSDVPLLGVCLGHQGLALAYGGNVTRASLPMHGRLSTIRHTGDSLFKDVAAYTDVVRYHSLVAQHPLPSELRATALTAVGDTIMALEHVSKPQFGIQFHPESIKTAAGKTIFQNFAAITRKYYANQESLTSSKFDSTALNTITERATEDSLPVDRLTTASRYVYVERIPLDSEATTTTEDIFARIFGSSSASFWLDSESGGPVQGRSDISPQISFMGSLDSVGSYSVEYRDFNSLAIRRYDEEKVSVENRTLFSYLRDRLTHERNAKVHIVDNDGLTIESSQIPFNVIGAYFGYIGYEVGYEATELLKRSKQWSAQYDLSFEESSTLKNISKWREESNSSQPLALLMYPSRYITYDHSSRVFYIISSTTDSCNLSQAKEGLLELSAKVISAISAESTIKDKVDNSDSQPTLLARKSKQGYKEDIDKILDNINKGETYEVCLTLQFHGSIKSVQKRERKRTSNTVAEESLETYRILRNLNPAPYASYFRYDPIKWRKSVPDAVPDSTLSWYKEGGFAICCTSPECYLKVDKSGLVRSKPIKGTARRNLNDSVADQSIIEFLAKDEKSQAENLMIVDLVRNDLGRVCEVKSVTVPKLFDIESYASVHQMVSTVEGKLRRDRDLLDLLVATFPGGSMTGAPKIRTMDLIRELERKPRGVYSGTIGYIGLNGVADLNIVIRTAILSDSQITVGAGGAIVALSDPDEEVDEVIVKASAVSKALGYKVKFK